MSSLLDHHRRRVLWTDLERERYYRILADHWEVKNPTATPAITPIATAPTTKLLLDVGRFMRVSPLSLN